MKRKLTVLFASFEAAPFVKIGGLGDVAGSLPLALRQAGCDARTILPKLSTIPERYKCEMELVAEFTVQLGWRNQYCGLYELTYRGVPHYFLDNEYYFKRDRAYGYYDDGERMAFFSKAIVESIPHIPEFQCDILHCNDWHTAMAPVFLRECYHGPMYDDVKTIFTIHNLKFQGRYSDVMLGDVLGLAGIPAVEDQLRCGYRTIDYMKGALHYSDLLNTVSPTYAEEIKSPLCGEGLDGVLRQREHALYGILDGIDTAVYDPAADPELPMCYTIGRIAGKAVCKAGLQRELGLSTSPDIPLIAMVGRLTEQKGLDLVGSALDELMRQELQIVILGTGDPNYEAMLRRYSEQYPGKLHAALYFDEAFSHRIYAGADLLLMPSLFEPCGLSQMISMRYGTLPIVRETGGLRDSVIPYNQYTGEGTGFTFRAYNVQEMVDAILRALSLFHSDRQMWNKLMHNAMSADFTWERAAKQYITLYLKLHPECR